MKATKLDLDLLVIILEKNCTRDYESSLFFEFNFDHANLISFITKFLIKKIV